MNNLTKLLSLILILSVLLSFCILPSKAQKEDALPIITAGDFNCDNKLNAVDLVLIKRELLGMTTGYDTVLADASGNSIFDLRDLSIVKNILVGNSNLRKFIVGKVDENNKITLSGSLPEDEYTLKYENSSGIMEDYADIGSLKITASKSNAVYDDFIAQNCAPNDTTAIGVYNSENKRVGFIGLGGLRRDFGEKLYSFGAISDVHLQDKTAKEDFLRALNFLNNTENVAFNTLVGDFTTNGKIQEFEEYRDFIEQKSPNTPIYAIAGNHESHANLNVESIIENYTGQPLYYSFEYGNDVFIMVGLASTTPGKLFTKKEMVWLQRTLEQNKNKRCFVFQHVRPDKACGNTGNIYDYDIWSGWDQSRFETLLASYTNVIFFHGHSHLTVDLQKLDRGANYDSFFGCHSVHVPSISVVRTGDFSGASSRVELYEESEGYVVEAYENGILLRCRDFIDGKFLPIATYGLDTTNAPTVSKQEFISIDWNNSTKIDVNTGETSKCENFVASKEIEIEDGYTYTISSLEDGCDTTVFFYNENGEYIEMLQSMYAATYSKDFWAHGITIPKEAKYMRISVFYFGQGIGKNADERLSLFSLRKSE